MYRYSSRDFGGFGSRVVITSVEPFSRHLVCPGEVGTYLQSHYGAKHVSFFIEFDRDIRPYPAKMMYYDWKMKCLSHMYTKRHFWAYPDFGDGVRLENLLEVVTF